MQPSDIEISRNKDIENLQRVARLLDSAVPVPGTQFRFGVDAFLGLIPGVGDGLGAFFSTAIVFQAARMGIPLTHLFQMIRNIFVDTLVGSVPILGDLFDFAWRANDKNLKVIYSVPRGDWGKPRSTAQIGWIFVLLFLAFVGLGLTLFVLLLKGILSLV